MFNFILVHTCAYFYKNGKTKKFTAARSRDLISFRLFPGDSALPYLGCDILEYLMRFSAFGVYSNGNLNLELLSLGDTLDQNG